MRPEPLNLASRPFRNETVPALGFALAAAAVLALTAWQVTTARRLLPAEGRTLHAEAEALDAELDALRREAQRLSAERPATDRLEEWRLVQGLVDRRTFSWTALLARLEELLPAGVRLVAITPELKGGVAQIELDAEARSREEGFELVRVLQRSGDFSEVLPTAVTPGAAGEQFKYRMTYHPRPVSPEGGAGAGPVPRDGVASAPLEERASEAEEPVPQGLDAPAGEAPADGGDVPEAAP